MTLRVVALCYFRVDGMEFGEDFQWVRDAARLWPLFDVEHTASLADNLEPRLKIDPEAVLYPVYSLPDELCSRHNALPETNRRWQNFQSFEQKRSTVARL